MVDRTSWRQYIDEYLAEDIQEQFDEIEEKIRKEGWDEGDVPIDVDLKHLHDYDVGLVGSIKRSWSTPQGKDGSGKTVREDLTRDLREYVDEEVEFGIADALMPDLDAVRVRLVNPVGSMWTDLHSSFTDSHGEMVAIDGVIESATDVESRAQQMVYQCRQCNTRTQPVPQEPETSQVNRPVRCTLESCNSQRFRPDLNHENTEMVDWQYLRVREYDPGVKDQPAVEEMQIVGGECGYHPRGERVTVLATVEHKQVGSDPIETYLDVVSIERESRDEPVEMTDDARSRIDEAIEKHGALDAAAQSVAPTHLGREQIKKSGVLSLVGPGSMSDEREGIKHDQMHMLMVGPPGVGKTRLMEAFIELSEKSRVVSGSDTTETSLVATASKEQMPDGSNGWVIHGGPMSMYSDGLIGLDEFDNVVNSGADGEKDSVSINEALEGSTHVSKAGVEVELQTDTTVVATANPTGTVLDEYDPLGDQIPVTQDIVGRFSWVWFVQPVDGEDRGELARRKTAEVTGEDREEYAVLGKKDMKRWVQAAQKMPVPEFTERATDLVEEMFVKLNDEHAREAGISVGGRRIMDVYKAASAHARLRFSETVEARDVKAVRPLVGEVVNQVGDVPDEVVEYSDDESETGDESESESDEQDEQEVSTDESDESDDEADGESEPVQQSIGRRIANTHKDDL